MPGRLSVVATPIGNLEDITLRGLRVLGAADLIAAEDTRWTLKLLRHHGISTATTSLHEHNEAAKIPRLLESLAEGRHLALVSDAGSPGVSDPGARLVRAALDAGIRVEPIPGPSAVIAAFSVSGITGSGLRFLGFPPVKGSARAIWLAQVGSAPEPVVCFEAPHRIHRLLEDLAAVLEPGRRVAICRELTKLHEQLVVGPISDVGSVPLDARGEFTLVIDAGGRTLPVGLGADVQGTVGEVFGGLTEAGWTRSAIVGAIGRLTGQPRRVVYDLVERSRQPQPRHPEA